MPDFGVLRGLRKGAAEASVKRGVLAEQAAKEEMLKAGKIEEVETNLGASSTQTIVEGGEQVGNINQAQQALAKAARAARAKDLQIGPGGPPGKLRPGLPEEGGIELPAELPLQTPQERPGVPALAPSPEAEARHLSSVELGDYDLEAAHQMNFNRLKTTDDVKAVIADFSEKNKALIQNSRRGEITNEQLKLLAADLNVDTEVIRQVVGRESGGVINAERILAARQVLAESAGQILGLARKITNGVATDMDRVRFRRQLQFHDDYQVAFMGARAETGRALNAFNIPVGIELDSGAVSRMRRAVDNLNGGDTDELAQMVSNFESVGQVTKFTKQYTRSRIAGVLQEVFINNILSGPHTHFVNTIGNALFMSMNTAEYGVAAQIGKFLPGAEHVQVGEASAMLFGQLSGYRDAMRYTKLAFRAGESLDDVVKFEGHTKRAISSQNLFPNGAPASVAAAVDLIGNIVTIPTRRLMVPADEFFKTLAYRGDLARQAYLEVSQRVAGGTRMSQDEIAAYVKNYMENPAISASRKAADYSRYVTFQTELGVSGRALQQMVSSTPGLFVVAPFVKTPTNIFKAGLLERSPLAIFSANFRQTIAKGGPERDLAVARVSMGSLTVAAAAAAAAAGYLTGGGPQDPGARSLLEASGWMPYSIVYEDPVTGELRYQSYARAEPLSYVIGATADLVEMRAYMDASDPLASENENLNRAIAAATAAVANNTMSKTFLSGVANFSEAMDDPARYMGDYLTQTTLQFLPYAAFRRQIGQMQDPLVRAAWDYTEKLKATSGLAGYSESLPPKRDVYGAPIEWRGGSVLGVMSPFPDRKATKDPITTEILNVMKNTGSVPVTMPAKKIDGERLTVQEYDQLVMASRHDPNFGGGLAFRDKLGELFGSTTYLLASPDMKAVLIKSVRESADKIGRAWLLQNNEAVAARVELRRLKQQELLLGEPR